MSNSAARDEAFAAGVRRARSPLTLMPARTPGAVTVLRGDASAALGLGHLMRLSALSEALSAAGRTTLFVARDDPAARGLLEGSAQRCQFLPDCSGEDDARLTIEAAKDVGADVIVTDVCHTAAVRHPDALEAYHRALGSAGALVVSFGGAQYADAAADIVVAPYVAAAPPALRAGAGELLLGPEYFVFRSEFTAAAAEHRTTPQRADRILVTIGGSDPAELTALTLDALARADAPAPTLRVVIGAGFPESYRRRLAALGGAFADRIEWLVSPPDMAGLMRWADLAITGDGLTKYESALLGTPAITLSRPDSDEAMNDRFAAAGTSLHLGCGLDAAELARAIAALRLDCARRAEMARRGTTLFDGRGAERIIHAIDARLARDDTPNARSGHPTC
jgi:UDP-2,4-diacetamido-2,4,6-trideoxy-beta-L-altropyranose hydrolase